MGIRQELHPIEIDGKVKKFYIPQEGECEILQDFEIRKSSKWLCI